MMDAMVTYLLHRMDHLLHKMVQLIWMVAKLHAHFIMLGLPSQMVYRWVLQVLVEVLETQYLHAAMLLIGILTVILARWFSVVVSQRVIEVPDQVSVAILEINLLQQLH